MVWDVTGSRLPSAPPPRDLAAAWADLMTEDAARGFAAARYLVDHPGEGMALLAEKVKPVAAADTKAVAALIAQLESPKFAEREKASKELAALGEAAAGPLRDADAKATSAELRQRLAPLVAALGEAKVTGERLRAVRAVEAWSGPGRPGPGSCWPRSPRAHPGRRSPTTPKRRWGGFGRVGRGFARPTGRRRWASQSLDPPYKAAFPGPRPSRRAQDFANGSPAEG